MEIILLQIKTIFSHGQISVLLLQASFSYIASRPIGYCAMGIWHLIHIAQSYRLSGFTDGLHQMAN